MVSIRCALSEAVRGFELAANGYTLDGPLILSQPRPLWVSDGGAYAESNSGTISKSLVRSQCSAVSVSIRCAHSETVRGFELAANGCTLDGSLSDVHHTLAHSRPNCGSELRDSSDITTELLSIVTSVVESVN